MGLFSFLDPITKPIAKVLQPATSAILTGGLSLISPTVKKAVSPISRALVPSTVSQGLNIGAGLLTKNPSLFLGGVNPQQGVQPMGLNIGGILGSVGTILGGNQNPIFQKVSEVSTLASQFFPVPTAGLPRSVPSSPIAIPTAAAMPMIRGGAMVARGFFNKFPALATAMQQLRARGITVKRSQLWSMLKRFGPEALVGGGLLTAGAVSELMVAGPGHRRMNPANVKALRRSMRRLESFHRLCVSADRLRSRGRGKTRSRGSVGAQNFVRQG